MAQHFRLGAAARTLSLKAIYRAGEDAAYATFCRLRWPQTNGEAVCPGCGSLETYKITTRRRFKCKYCEKQFSVTSGTIFASRKLSFMDLLAAICLFVKGAKGRSAVQFSLEMGVQYKTAWVMAHKLREAMQTEYEDASVSGLIDVDGMHWGGKVRKANLRKDRAKTDGRRERWKTGRVRVVVAIRQREGRTLTFITQNESEGVDLVRRTAMANSIIFHDEGSWWGRLGLYYETYGINHQEAYSLNGIHTNYVESFFARLRNMLRGSHHQASCKYLHQYATHAAWLEDHRRVDDGALTRRILGAALAAPISRAFKAYWQRRHTGPMAAPVKP